MNGYSNGHNGYEMEDNASFLFTSESVGEGHPGERRKKIHFETFSWRLRKVEKKKTLSES